MVSSSTTRQSPSPIETGLGQSQIGPEGGCATLEVRYEATKLQSCSSTGWSDIACREMLDPDAPLGARADPDAVGDSDRYSLQPREPLTSPVRAPLVEESPRDTGASTVEQGASRGINRCSAQRHQRQYS